MLRLLILIFLMLLALGCTESKDFISYYDPCILADSNAFYIIKSEVLEPGTGVVLSNQLLEKYDFNGNLLSSIHLNNKDDYYDYYRKMFLKGVNDSTICLVQNSSYLSYKKDFKYSLYTNGSVTSLNDRYYFFVENYYPEDTARIFRQNMSDGTKDILLSFYSKTYSDEWRVAESQYMDNQGSLILYSGEKVSLMKFDGDSWIKSENYSIEGIAGIQQNDSTLILAKDNILKIYTVGSDTFNLQNTINLPSGNVIRFTLSINQNIIIYEKSQFSTSYDENDKGGEIVLYNITTREETLLFTNEIYDYGY